VSALTVRQVAEKYGVSQQTVLGWIRSGQLRAINVVGTPTEKNLVGG
jgi:excisionase family DNA binding protein